MKKYKQLFLGFVIGAVLFGIVPVLAEAQQIQAVINDIKITLNGSAVDTQGVKPIVYDDRTYVPARYVAEALGATVNYNETTNTVELTKSEGVQSMSTETQAATVAEEWISGRDLAIKVKAMVSSGKSSKGLLIESDLITIDIQPDDFEKAKTETVIINSTKGNIHFKRIVQDTETNSYQTFFNTEDLRKAGVIN